LKFLSPREEREWEQSLITIVYHGRFRLETQYTSETKFEQTYVRLISCPVLRWAKRQQVYYISDSIYMRVYYVPISLAGLYKLLQSWPKRLGL